MDTGILWKGPLVGGHSQHSHLPAHQDPARTGMKVNQAVSDGNEGWCSKADSLAARSCRPGRGFGARSGDHRGKAFEARLCALPEPLGDSMICEMQTQVQGQQLVLPACPVQHRQVLPSCPRLPRSAERAQPRGVVVHAAALEEAKPVPRNEGHSALLSGLGAVGDVAASHMPWLLRIAHVR